MPTKPIVSILPKEEKHIKFWKERLQGIPPLQLPTDYQKPTISQKIDSLVRFTLEGDTVEQLKTFCNKEKTPLTATFLAAFQILLSRHSGQQDLCVGTTTLEEHSHSIFPIKAQLQPKSTFPALVQEISEALKISKQHPFLPFLQNETKQSGASLPCFQAMLSFHPEGTTIKPNTKTSAFIQSQMTLNMELREKDGQVQGILEYSPELFKTDTIQKMVGHYRQLLDSIAADPTSELHTLEMLSQEEKTKLFEFNHYQKNLGRENTLVSLFEQQAQKFPDAIAVSFGDQNLTYRQLDEQANQLAHFLIQKGVEEESLIPICIERSLEMMVGFLGIMKAGAAYVPIDPEYPVERIQYILEDTGAKMVLTQEGSTQNLPESVNLIYLDKDRETFAAFPKESPQTQLSPKNLAYVIYTSGSTGKPKGVLIEHKGLSSMLTARKKHYKSDEPILLIPSIAFDASITVMFGALSSGGNVLLCKSADIKDPVRIKPLLEATKTILCVPSYYRVLLEEGLLENSNLSRVIVAGEKLEEALVNLHFERQPDVPLYNEYGPTEATVWSSAAEVRPNERVTIGKPIENTAIFLLGPGQELNPVGIAGELCIAGDGLARGYLNRPKLTAEKFIENTIEPAFGPRIYRTGDMARWLPDGNLEYLGRIDNQVKIRGFRVELGEIENHLQQHDKVSQAVVTVQQDRNQNMRLIGYLIPAEKLDQNELTDYLAQNLPEYMVPELWMEMEKFPLTRNGKVDRKALPPAALENLQRTDYQAPKTTEERQLVEIWKKLLGLEKIGVQDDFFKLGGNSLLAMRLIAAIRKEMNKTLSIKDLFEAPQIAKLASKLSTDENASSTLQRVDRPKHIPLSYSQQGLWLIDRMDGSTQYHLPVLYRIKGKLDTQAMTAAIQSLVNRHEVLRTVFYEMDGEPYQQVLEENHWQPEQHRLPENFSDEELTKEIERIIKLPFDLAEDHLLRASLIQVNPDEMLLLVVTHHIASDGWSADILKNELISLYHSHLNQSEANLPPLQIQFADFAFWQKENLQGEKLEGNLRFWKQKLQGTSPLHLPTDYTRPPVQKIEGDAVSFKIEKDLQEKLQAWSKQQGSTLYMTLLAAFKVLLYRYSGQEDICVGTPTAGRERQEVESLIGYFVNTLPLRTQVEGSKSFAEFLQDIKATTVEAFEHGQAPFEKIVEALGQERDRSRTPIYQVMFSLHNTPQTESQQTEFSFEEAELVQLTSIFDLTFELTEKKNGLDGKVIYGTALYQRETIERMAQHFNELLRAVIADPTKEIGRVDFLSQPEKELLLKEFNPSLENISSKSTILDMFAAQVEQTPDATAVYFEEQTLTYQELDARSNQLAHYLIGRGIGPEDMVPICLDRCLEMMVGILGILKAGAAYVPVDPSYPEERISYILEDTQANVALCNSESKANIPFAKAMELIDLEAKWPEISLLPDSAPSISLTGENLVYVIYTSGSTGKPKGVLLEHRTLVTSTLARQAYYKDVASALLITSFAFDSSIGVIFGALTTGSTLMLCKSAFIKNPNSIQHLFNKTESMLCVPSYYRFLLEEGVLNNASMKRVSVAGESLDETLVNLHFQKTNNIPLHNEYGPTEGTIWATVAPIFPNQPVTIGKPIANTVVYIRGKDGALNPVGVPGELCIAGQGLARGYLNRPEQTADKFVQNTINPDQGERLYRTGDLARWLPNGQIEFLGRLDSQVKIRGYRIELEEIETTINGLEEVKQSAVIVREDVPGQKKLVGYVAGDTSFAALEESRKRSLLKKELRQILPEYMVPTEWVFLEKLPLTPNNKIDRKNLPKPKVSAKQHQQPTSPTERLIAGIWCDALKVESVDTQTDFFDAGGHSLLAVKVMSALEKEWDKKLPLNLLFQYGSISELAKYLDASKEKKEDWSSLVPIKPSGTKAPLFIVHGAGSIVSIYYQLANIMDEEQPVYGFQPKGLNGKDSPHQSVEEMAAYYNKLMMDKYPDGPYRIGGYSFGGYVAYEMARQLKAQGKEVDKLILFDTMALPEKSELSTFRKIKLKIGKRVVDLMFLFKEPKGFWELKVRSFSRKKDKLLSYFRKSPEVNSNDHSSIIKRMRSNNVNILHQYKLPPYPGELHLFKVKNRMFYVEDTQRYGWGPLVDKVTPVQVGGHHNNIFHDPVILEEMAAKIQKVLDEG